MSNYHMNEGVAVITLDHPPLNVLSYSDRLFLDAAVREALADNQVLAIVLTGAGRGFSAGADISEMDLPSTTQEPTPNTLFARIETSPKPVVAALHGVALGGGLELAMACHARVAHMQTQVGLPEVNLGLVPGAGGTQRLPRLVGLEVALSLIGKGRNFPADALRASGLFDSVVDEHVLATAITRARDLAARAKAGEALRQTRNLSVNMPNAQAFLAFARGAVRATPDGNPARLAALDCLEAAATLPFDEGLTREADSFARLRTSPQSAGFRHAFMAERRAAHVDDMPSHAKPMQISHAAVIGGGTMGVGIAMSLLDAGIDVALIERDQPAVERALSVIRDRYEASRSKGRLAPEECARRIDLCRGAVGLGEISGVDLVIEAVYEDMATKRAIFEELDRRTRPGALLATNTSMLDVNQIASATQRPRDVLGLHFFSPAHVMRLLEVVRGAHTSAESLSTALALARRIGKTAVVARVCEGFIGNRMFEPYLMQAGLLLDEGALPQQVDRAIEKWGMAMGPFRVCDLAGNDIGAAIRRDRLAKNPALVYSRTCDAVVALGRLGQKTGRGWYDYPPGQRTPQPSEQVNNAILEESRRLGLKRRAIGDEEIVDRLTLALVNEGAQLLEERIAQRASDIDVAYITGYGFPRWRGGPMFAADARGLRDVLAAIRRMQVGPEYQDRTTFWRPAALLERLANNDLGFADFAEGVGL